MSPVFPPAVPWLQCWVRRIQKFLQLSASIRAWQRMSLLAWLRRWRQCAALTPGHAKHQQVFLLSSFTAMRTPPCIRATLFALSKRALGPKS